MRIDTILCPIDFSELSAPELAIAAQLARTFRARLVLHHNRVAIAPGLARAWDWETSHRSERLGEAEAEHQMAAALAAVPDDVAAEGVISVGPIGLIVLSLAERVPADLIVIGSHGWSTEKHASITERIIAGAPCPVLSLHEGGKWTEPLRLVTAGGASPRVVVPTDFSPTARHAVEYAYALSRIVPLHLELLHVLPAGRHASAAGEAARQQLDATVPDDMRTRVATRIRHGEPTTEILAHLAEVRPQFAVLGEHSRHVLRHLFTRDTTRAVMHEASCPVWIVPPRAAV